MSDWLVAYLIAFGLASRLLSARRVTSVCVLSGHLCFWSNVSVCMYGAGGRGVGTVRLLHALDAPDLWLVDLIAT